MFQGLKKIILSPCIANISDGDKISIEMFFDDPTVLVLIQYKYSVVNIFAN